MLRPADASADIEASVVIPAHDAAPTLHACLASVFASVGVRLEVIVVDDGSRDDTAAIARRFPCRLIAVAPAIFAANARNLAARHARGEILVFLDADETVLEDTVGRFVQALRANPQFDAVVGSLTADTPAAGFFSKFKNFQHHFTHQAAQSEGSTLDSGRMAIRRTAFEQLGGFEPAFAGASIEDIALGYRMRRHGRRIRFEPSIQVTHHKCYTLASMVRSDVLHRAIPWTALMLRERTFRNDLNTRTANVASVIVASTLPLSVLAALAGLPIGLLTAAAAVPLIGLLNASFLHSAAVTLGIGFALRASAFLPFMYLYQGVGLGLGLLAWATGRSAASRQRAPAPRFRAQEPEDRPPSR